MPFISKICIACLLSFYAGWLLEPPIVNWLLGDLEANRLVANKVESPAVIKLTPAQKAFWAYLEQFNKLPDNPTAEMISAFNTKGIPPKFHYLNASKTSVIGDIRGLTEHRDQFIRRYAWVQPLLNKYKIEIPVSPERFTGTATEIGHKYEMLMMTCRQCKATPDNELSFVSNFLEGLLAVDFVFARGSDIDKHQALDLFDGVFAANELLDPFRKKLEASFIAPASSDIGWAIMADNTELIKTTRAATISRGFFEYSPAQKINFSKWMLKMRNILPADNENIKIIHRGIVHNEQVKLGLLEYSIYSAHTQDLGRPADAPWLIVIKSLFKRIHPNDQNSGFAEYLKFLDAAYPKTKL